MKRNFFLNQPVKILLAAVVLSGLFAFGYYEGSEARLLQNNTLSLEEAQTFYAGNKADVKGFYLDRAAVLDMYTILKANEKADGVRLYYGEDAEGKSVNMIVTVKDGADDTGSIMKTAGMSSPCPNMCDTQSEIRN